MIEQKTSSSQLIWSLKIIIYLDNVKKIQFFKIYFKYYLKDDHKLFVCKALIKFLLENFIEFISIRRNSFTKSLFLKFSPVLMLI